MRLADLRREIDWQLQNGLTWSAPVLQPRLRDPRSLIEQFTPAARARHRQLAARYPLAHWSQVCNARGYLLNCQVLDWLDHYAEPPSRMRALDVGSGRWGYLPALVSWSGGNWDGVELDAHRRDWTLATRRGYAENLLNRFCPECRYRAGSVLANRERYATITWFLPFVARGAFTAARLPQRYFAPRELLRHVHSLLALDGQALIINQGEQEAAVQQDLFSEAGIPARALGLLRSDFDFFQQPRHGWHVQSTATRG